MSKVCCDKAGMIIDAECLYDTGKFSLADLPRRMSELFTVRLRAPADYRSSNVVVVKGKELPVRSSGLIPAALDMCKIPIALPSLLIPCILALPALAFAAVPALSPAEFGGAAVAPGAALSAAASPEAHWIWAVLASPVAVAVLTWLAKFVDDWFREHRFLRENAELLEIYDFVSHGVGATYDNLVHRLKHPDDGTKRKLTEADIKRAREMAVTEAVAYAKSNGVDLMKRVGPELFRKMIEQVISDRKAGRYVTGPLAPLPELQP